jgi:hypothetical protein
MWSCAPASSTRGHSIRPTSTCERDRAPSPTPGQHPRRGAVSRYREFEDWFKHTQDIPGAFYCGRSAMNPLSMCSPLSTPPPLATSASYAARESPGAQVWTQRWMRGSPAWKSIGAPAIGWRARARRHAIDRQPGRVGLVEHRNRARATVVELGQRGCAGSPGGTLARLFSRRARRRRCNARASAPGGTRLVHRRLLASTEPDPGDPRCRADRVWSLDWKGATQDTRDATIHDYLDATCLPSTAFSG